MAEVLRFRNSQGDLVEVPAVAATRMKNAFGAVLEQALKKGAVAITRHDAPKAVLVSYDEFQALVRTRSQDLQALTAEYDALLERMQASRAKKGMAAAFDAAPAELGRAAADAARRPKAAKRKASGR